MINIGQYKSFILLLSHFSQQSLYFINIRCSYLLVHLHKIEIILSLSLSLSLSFSYFLLHFSHVCIAFNFICNTYSVIFSTSFPSYISSPLMLFFSNCMCAPIYDVNLYPLPSIIPNSQIESIIRLAKF